ncbi:MAG: flagellar hook assembly protein FlgD [Halomonas sp.]|uniref:Basal-body rod modification protein FlgD n=1 Tax=Halomonas citrativorans TaxID=2742612 RepID=A0A1R4I1T9_9GAMM|nr:MULTISPECIES: flagellar hook assembly protein FlgD [Halomonas]SJN13699.1 Flagellar basal-body rod modification protein FlgD [Halomonas citrativorans]HCR97108.1 flagellar hook assembly protein FlgD [Halomonas sp.]
MSTIDANVVNAVNSGGSNGLSARQSDELRNSFMTLLVTQLQNQDPLNPMENAEMTSQLAQINTVSGIEELNSTLEGITSQMDANQALQAAGLIDKAVLVPGNNVMVSVDEESGSYATPFGIELDSAAENVEVTVVSKAGEVVYTKDLGAVAAGVESFSWGGLTNDGVAVPEGAYRVNFKAMNADGELLESRALNYALVQGVSPGAGGSDVRLDLGAVYGQVALDQIKQIL